MKLRPLRAELKFVVHHSVKDALMARWSPFLMRAPFTDREARTPILSQYYDSPDLAFYREKLDGIEVRNKVRLRVYGMNYDAGQTTFLEIKHRQGDKVRKYRQLLRDFAPADLDPRRWRFDDAGMRAAFMTLLERYRLRPSAQVYYQREAYEGVADADVRVTWDSVLLAMHPGERLDRALLYDPARRMMADTLFVLEVKATGALPAWFHDGVVAAELRHQTVPKYITAVEVLGLHDNVASGIYA
jgi:hypothetical protein